MSIASKIHPLRHLPTAALLLSLLCACSFYEYEDNTEEADPVTPTEKYINLSIVVSSGNEGTTRAPLGGENGDGREAGLERENKVTGITLMLYQDDDGINTNKDTTIDFIKYFSVTEDAYDRDGAGTSYGDKKRDEARYSTGDQLIGSDIDFSEKYHAIVVANWDLSARFTVNASKVKEIRDHLAGVIYSGSGIGIDAANFVMSLEKDALIDFSNITPEANGNKLVYKIDNAIHIERLAARVDFWMKGAEYKEIESDNSDDKRSGYEYAVTKSDGSTPSPDKFLLTAVTPFNLSNDSEYLIKRITTDNTQTDWSVNSPIYYLIDEKETNTSNSNLLNYVLDPHTTSKTGNEVPKYMMEDYALDNFLKTDGSSTYERKKILLSSCQDEEQKSSYTEAGETGDNIIVCYSKENTLWKTTPLYYYGTGLCIEGYYYKYDAEQDDYTSEKLTYYGFLRHQGENNSGSYEIYTGESLEEVQKKLQNNENSLKGDFPMNFGVVRNNIYRISIDKITERGEEPQITWKIKVKKWDEFTHSTIYM